MDKCARDRLIPTKTLCFFYNVALRETIRIPPLDEAIVIDEAQSHLTYMCALVEPCLSIMSRKYVLLAKSVVDPSSCDLLSPIWRISQLRLVS